MGTVMGTKMALGAKGIPARSQGQVPTNFAVPKCDPEVIAKIAQVLATAKVPTTVSVPKFEPKVIAKIAQALDASKGLQALAKAKVPRTFTAPKFDADVVAKSVRALDASRALGAIAALTGGLRRDTDGRPRPPEALSGTAVDESGATDKATQFPDRANDRRGEAKSLSAPLETALPPSSELVREERSVGGARCPRCHKEPVEIETIYREREDGLWETASVIRGRCGCFRPPRSKPQLELIQGGCSKTCEE